MQITKLESSIINDPEELLKFWRQERARRIGKILCYCTALLLLVWMFADFITGRNSWVLVSDLASLVGCGISFYWVRSKKQPLYYWWPLYWGLWISMLPSIWVTGGLNSPYLGAGLAALYVIGAMMDSKNVLVYWGIAILHIPVLFLIETFYPLTISLGPAPIATATVAGATLSGVFICIHAMLRTESELAYKFSEHYSCLASTKEELVQARNELERRVEERTLQLEESLIREKAAKLVAENASQAKMQFLANMSHEIRTPLNSILGFSELIAADNPEKENRDDYIRRIRTNGSQLLHLIDDILDLSKFEAGRIPFHYTSFDLKSLIENVVSSFMPALSAKKLDLKLEYLTDTVPRIHSDANRLSQILTNLLSNAIKFSEKGFIRVVVNCENDRRSGLTNLTIDIEDTGIGISAENQKSLFQVFSQGDSSTARKFGGSGLGLVLSKRIAEAFHGKLVLKKSTPQVGSHFQLQIPVERALMSSTPELPKGKVKITDRTFPDRKILLVEDSPDNAYLVGHYIKSLGIDVDLTTDGLQAAKLARERHYDCILMDMQMPVMDGLEATKIIRAQGFKNAIIALTAHALPAEAAKSLQAGCNLHLTKPIDRNELVRIVSEQLSLAPVMS